MPGTIRWRGDAQPRRQIDWLRVRTQVSRIFSYSLSCNRKDLTVYTDELLTGERVSDVLEAIWTAWNNTAIAEFKEVTLQLIPVGTTDGLGLHTGIKILGEAIGRPYTFTAGSIDRVGVITVTEVRRGRAASNEIQRISHLATGGTFTITYNGAATGNIAWNASAATVQTALDTLTGLNGNTSVTGNAGGPWSVEFVNSLATVDVNPLTCNGANLTGQILKTITVTQDGRAGINQKYALVFTTNDSLLVPSPIGAYTFSITDPVTSIVRDVLIGTADSQATVQDSLDAAIGYGACTVRIAAEYEDVAVSLQINTWEIEFNGDYWGSQPITMERQSPLDEVYLVSSQTGASTGRDEKQQITFNIRPAGGTWTISFRGATTGALAYNITTAALKIALEALSTIDGVNVTDPPFGIGYAIEFTSPGSEDLPLITAVVTSLTGGNPIVTNTQSAVRGIDEFQRVTLPQCTGGTFTLTYAGQTTAPIAYNAAAYGTVGSVAVLLKALSNIGNSDIQVGGPDGGPWLIWFQNALGSLNVAALTGSGALLTGAASVDSFHITSAADPIAVSGSDWGGADEEVRVEPTGPNWWSEAENWTLNRIPIDGDTVVFEDSTVSCWWGLDQSLVNPDLIRFEASFTGGVGLPTWEGDYEEYRDRRLSIGHGTIYGVMEVQIGVGDGSGSPLIRLDTGAGQALITCWKTAQGIGGTGFSFDWVGTHADNTLRLYRGRVSVAMEATDTGKKVNTILIGFVDNEDGDSVLAIGTGVTVGAIQKRGGQLTSESALPDEFVQLSGTTTLIGTGGAADLTIRGGKFHYNSSGTLVDATISNDAILNFDGDLRPKTITNPIKKYGDKAKVVDTNFVVLPALKVACYESTLIPEWGSNYLLTREVIP